MPPHRTLGVDGPCGNNVSGRFRPPLMNIHTGHPRYAIDETMNTTLFPASQHRTLVRRRNPSRDRIPENHEVFQLLIDLFHLHVTQPSHLHVSILAATKHVPKPLAADPQKPNSARITVTSIGHRLLVPRSALHRRRKQGSVDARH